MQTRTWIATASLAALCGCATAPQLPPIRDGAAVRVEVAMSAQATGRKEIENTAMGHDSSTGARAGAVAGGLWGFACGPFAALCVPVGASVGAFYGSVAGAGVGLTGALSNDKAAQLRERLQRAEQANPPIEALRRYIDERARQRWRVAAADPGVTVTVELQDLLLTSSRDEQIGFIVHVRVSARQAGADGAVTQKLFAQAGPTSSLTVWLDERNDFFDTSIRLTMQQLAAQIVAELGRS